MNALSFYRLVFSHAVFLLVLIGLSLTSCQTKQKRSTEEKGAGAVQNSCNSTRESRFGSYDSSTDTCNCGLGKSWNTSTSACVDDESKLAEVRRACKDDDDCDFSTGYPICEDGTWSMSSYQCSKSGSTSSSLTKSFCESAGGDYEAIDDKASKAFCDCGRGEIIVDDECETFDANSIKNACEDAGKSGDWRNNYCYCGSADDDEGKSLSSENGKVFSPNRGGCVEKTTDSELLAKVCASYNGIFDATSKDCQCPTGFFWHEEKCLSTSAGYSDKYLCESSQNKGTWQGNSCLCANGAIWNFVNKSCPSQTNTPCNPFVGNCTQNGIFNSNPSYVVPGTVNPGIGNSCSQTGGTPLANGQCHCPGSTSVYVNGQFYCQPPIGGQNNPLFNIIPGN